MNILIYNCFQFDDKQRRGGGVSVYIRNLIPALLAQGHQVTFLGSGLRYSMFSRKLKIRQTENIYESKGVKSYEVINSPVKAPGHDAFGSLEVALNSRSLEVEILDFVKKNGIDEIHFHGIEGIASSVVDSLRKQSNCRIKAWLHNYHWICPQIELFRNASERCEDYRDGANCLDCMAHVGDMTSLKKYQSLGDFIEGLGLSGKPLGVLIFNWAFNAFQMFAGLRLFFKLSFGEKGPEEVDPWQERSKAQTKSISSIVERSSIYKKWRETNAEILNSCTDTIYAVSNIVRDQYEARGVVSGKIKVAPIGMPEDNFDDTFSQPKVPSDKLRIGFFGYSIASKGLDYLISVIEVLAEQYPDKLSFFSVSSLNPVLERRLALLSEKVDISILQGYERSEMGSILQNVDVVVVPSICWETYNQVAYEAIKANTPVLVSDTVGISMIVNNPDFVFKSGDQESLIAKLTPIIEDSDYLASFWKNKPNLPSYDEHVQQVTEDFA